ncbi:Protein abhd8 [Mactra antiquata]
MASERNCRNNRRVAPEPGSCDNIIEIRPDRVLRIKHFNKKERDEKFEKEMQAYLQYREIGALGSAVSVPAHLLGHGAKKDQRTSEQQHNSQLPEMPLEKLHTSDEMERCISEPEGLNNSFQKSKIQSPSRNSLNSAGVHSLTGVNVAVQRPSSEVYSLGHIGESNEEHNEIHIVENGDHGTRSLRKTKDHRPISAKRFRKKNASPMSDDMSESLATLPTLETLSQHLASPYKEVTLFFIHGVGGSADIWNAQIEFFASLGLEVIAPDLIGHGYSCSPDVERAYHFNQILADLEQIFDKYCKRQNIVIGHSYGCAFAAALGRRRARRVSKLILISGGAPIPLAPQPGVFSLPVCMLTCIKPCILSKFEKNAFHNAKMSGLSREQAFDLPLYVLSHMMKGQDWLDGDELYHAWLTQPTLLLHGSHDKFVSMQEEQEMEQAIFYSRLVVVDNASHMVMMESPKKVNDLMYHFIFQSHHDPPDPDRPKTRMSGSRSARYRNKQLA